MNWLPWRRPPAADIQIRQTSTHSYVTIGSRKPVELLMQGTAAVDRGVAQFLNAVEPKRPRELEPTAEAAHAFVAAARWEAYNCFIRVTADSANVFANLIADLGEAMTRLARRPEPPMVEVLVEDTRYLPWEWLAEPVPRPGGEHAQNGTVAAALTGILGFTAVMCRRPVRGQSTRRENHALAACENKVCVKYIRHVSLTGSDQQESYFQVNHQYIDLGTPLPDPSAADFDLPALLVDPCAGRKAGTDQVVHLHCHHGTISVEKLPDDFVQQVLATSCMVLRDEPRLAVTYDQLLSGIFRPDRQVDIDRPLIFLNLCRADFHPLSAQSFSHLLLRNDNRGVISTSMKVPDEVAAWFATRFYDNLLLHGARTASQALRDTKQDLARRMGNPLGILYTYSGDPALMVVPTLVSQEAAMPF